MRGRFDMTYRAKGRKKSVLVLTVYSILFAFLVLFCLYPLFLIAMKGITDGSGRITSRYLVDILRDGIYREVIWFTFWQAALSSILTLLFAFPGAYLLSRYDFPGKRFVIAASTIPFVIPSMVLAVGLIAIFGSSGVLSSILSSLSIPAPDLIGSRSIIILAHVFFNFPIALRILLARFSGLDPTLVHAARSLGAGRVRTFFTVVLPQMRYSVLSALSLVFTFCFLTFGIVLLLGGLNHTIEVEIRSLFVGLSEEGLHHAGALVLVESVIVLVTTYVYIWSSSRVSGRAEIVLSRPGTMRRKISPAGRFLVGTYVMLVLLIVFLPLLMVFLGSFMAGRTLIHAFTLDWYWKIMTMESGSGFSVTPLDSIRNSLLFGLLTMLLCLPLSYMTAWVMVKRGGRGKRFMDMLLLFPLGASSVALGYGLVSAYSSPPVSITGTWYIIVLVHSVIAYPIGARAIYSSMKSFPPQLERAARSLGASPVESFFRVKLPLILPGILVAAVFAFAVSIGELGATLMVSSEEYITMPVYLYRTVEGAGRELGPMYAFSVILMSTAFLSFLSIEIIQKVFLKWGVRGDT